MDEDENTKKDTHINDKDEGKPYKNMTKITMVNSVEEIKYQPCSPLKRANLEQYKIYQQRYMPKRSIFDQRSSIS